MGKHARKTPYKKLLKEEKAKTKLKVSYKTILPKGQNLTSTSFKVKKVIVRNQLKEHIGEIVSKNHLNVKELISRLHHHNAPLRCNALINLTEMVTTHHYVVLDAHLPALVHAASSFILDKEQDVRSEAIKLLSNILSKTNSDKLTELFEAILKHLACAMSHINADIRACSLTMLDILIDKQPNLTARFCQPVILPAFIDLISTKFADSDRKLIIQYNDNMTSSTWRIKVLARLYALLKAIVCVQNDQHAAHNDQEYVKKVKWSDEKPIYASLYNCSFDTTRALDLFRMQSEKEGTQGDQKSEIQNYAQVLVPLLLNIFMEVAPQKMKNGRAVHLSNDGAILLKFTCEIILLLWQIFECSDSSECLKSWFSTKFTDSIVEHLLVHRFPFVLLDQSEALSSKSCKKSKNKMTVAVCTPGYSKLLADKQCTYLNVILCKIYLFLCTYSRDFRQFKVVTHYITDRLPICTQLDREIVSHLLECADSLFSMSMRKEERNIDICHLIKVIKQLYDDASSKSDVHHNFVSEKTFGYLYRIVLIEKANGCIQQSELISWLNSLPVLLTRKRLSFYKVKCIADIARCNIPSFVDALDGYIESILDNLPNLDLIAERKADRVEGKKLIANLLYRVQTWDTEFIDGLKGAVKNGYFSHLNNYVHDIIECKWSEQSMGNR